jgi:uncharacterized membrane protein
MSSPETPVDLRPEHHHERALNVTISRVLVIGLASAIALLVVGIVLVLVRPGLTVNHETSVAHIPRALWRLEPGGFFGLGLAVLLATPFARVAALFLAYTRRRQWIFAGISAFVLGVLVLSGYLGLTVG